MKGSPIPVKFESEEEAVIEACAKETGLSKSEIIRRAVRYVGLEYHRTKSADFLWPLVAGKADQGEKKQAARKRAA